MASLTDSQTIERLPSQIAGLDRILEGGFLRGGIYIFKGSPGSGKTILGNQICFNQVAVGHRALYITLLAESHARLLQHIRSLGFFDESAIPDKLYYMSAFRTLEDEGLKGLLTLLRREVRSHRADLVVLDGLIAAEEQSPSVSAFKKFLNELQTQADLAGCTMFLLTGESQDNGDRPEHTMVDGLIELTDELYGWRAQRDLQVRKFRGSGFLRGRHSFDIGVDGITVYPRLETLPIPHLENGSEQGLPSGVPDLDKILGNGLPEASTSVLFGPTGSGKTTFGLHFASQSTPDHPGLYYGFYERPERLIIKARQFGLALEPLIEQGALHLEWQPPNDVNLDALGHRLLETVAKHRIKRLFIDGFGAFERAALTTTRLQRYFAALAAILRSRDVTCVMTTELPEMLGPVTRPPLSEISNVADNMILLRYVELHSRLCRLVSVLKVRDSAFDPTLREFHITDQGIRIEGRFTNAEAVLSGFAHRVEEAPSAISPEGLTSGEPE